MTFSPFWCFFCQVLEIRKISLIFATQINVQYQGMENETDDLRRLCREIEQGIGREMRTPRDFDWLSGLIDGRISVRLSPTTLKRTWGYLQNPAHPSQWTMDALAQFAGYKDFASYASADRATLQSNFIVKERIDTEQLPTGSQLRITWLPNRECVEEHQGNGNFVVKSARNTKLAEGDTFTCHLMIQGEPLFLDHVVHKGLASLGFVAGKRDGVTISRV